MTTLAIVAVAVSAALISAGLLWNAERARQQNERILNEARQSERAALETLRVFIDHNKAAPSPGAGRRGTT